MPPRLTAPPSRRWLLAAVGVVGSTVLGGGVAGCTSAGGTEAPTEPAADVAAREHARRLELELVAAYDDAASRLPALAATLAVVRDHHAEHARALGAALPADTPTTAQTGPQAPAPSRSGEPVGLDQLVRREAAAAQSHRDGCLTASGSLAALLASLHAAETCHGSLLATLTPGAPTEPVAGAVASPDRTTEATGSAGPGDATATVAALSAMLAVEHAAVYAATTAGGTLAPLGDPAAAAREFARDSYAVHRRRRDELTATIAAADGEAPAAFPAYRLPIAPTDPTSALALLADVEDRCAAAAHDAIAALAGEQRSATLASLTASAVRAQRIRLAVGLGPDGASRPLPGA